MNSIHNNLPPTMDDDDPSIMEAVFVLATGVMMGCIYVGLCVAVPLLIVVSIAERMK
jgi:hypothetical protein